ncbi:MAG: oxidoreductase [Ferruginibacter sp.]
MHAQTVTPLTSGTNTSLRGLSVVTDKIIWVSGSHGTIGRSIDNGKTWKWMIVRGFENVDFRDIEAFSETSAVIMGIASPAYILRTDNGGDAWRVTFENKDSTMFLDAIEFWNEQSGVVIGDPIKGHFFIARSFDGGLHWRGIPLENYPKADSGEALFAASGTALRKLDNQEACFVTGGVHSRLFIRDEEIELPIIQGKETTGANSIGIKTNKILIIAGGDYTKPDSTFHNCFITKDAGKTWIAPTISPHGYRSCVEYISKNDWISCGTNGVDYTKDDGNTWTSISNKGFNVCRKAKNGNTVFLAGSNGTIAMLTF